MKKTNLFIFLITIIITIHCSPKPKPLSEDCIVFDYRKAEVKKTEIGWIIATDRSSLLSFGDNEDEARLALNIIKHYRINKQCFVGRPNPSMVYYLVNNQSPVGPYEGEDCLYFNPNRLQVKKINGRWKIIEDKGQTKSMILDFKDNENEAKEAFEIIKKYGFTYTCYVGRPNPSMSYFRR